MRRGLLVLLLAASPALGASYYVDCDNGNDATAGTSTTAPWRTLAKVNASTFVAGDTIALARGCVWYEELTPPSSGSAGLPITFTAYGSGDPPWIDGTVLKNDVADWTADATLNIWSTTVASGTTVLELDGMGGTVKAAKADLAANGDYVVESTTLYLYSTGRPTTVWSDIRSWERTKCVNVNAKNYLTFRGIGVRRWRSYGFWTNGDEIDLQFCEAWFGNPDTNVGAHAVSTSGAGSAGDVRVTHCTLHYPGGIGIYWATAGTLTVTNSIIAGARAWGIQVNGAGSASYDYSLVDGNCMSNGIGGNPQTTGAVTDGGHNVFIDLGDIAPLAYPVYSTIHTDDASGSGAVPTFLGDVIAEFGARVGGPYPLSAAAICARSVGQEATWSAWRAAGQIDLGSHSWSHIYAIQDWNGGGNDPALAIQYTGTGTAATVTKSNTTYHLTTAVTGGPGGEDLDYDLKAAAYESADELCDAIDALAVYTCTNNTGYTGVNLYVHTTNLAEVSGQDIKTAPYSLAYDKSATLKDEIRSCVDWLRANVYAGQEVDITHTWPGGERDGTADALVTAGRASQCVIGDYAGQLFWGSWSGGCLGRWSGEPIAGHTTDEIRALARTVALYSAVHMGRPLNITFHPTAPPTYNTTAVEIGVLLDQLLAVGTTYVGQTELMRLLMRDVRWSPAGSAWPQVYRRPAVYAPIVPVSGSPLIDAGAATALTTDILGRPIQGTPDIGAYEYQPASVDAE